MSVDLPVTYVGGHSSLQRGEAVEGRLVLTDELLAFEMQGEWFERIFEVRWAEVAG